MNVDECSWGKWRIKEEMRTELHSTHSLNVSTGEQTSLQDRSCCRDEKWYCSGRARTAGTAEGATVGTWLQAVPENGSSHS